MPKRKERVAPPPPPGGWDFRFANSDAVKGWEHFCASSPANARTAWDKVTTDPRQRSTRQHPLKGTLGPLRATCRTVGVSKITRQSYPLPLGIFAVCIQKPGDPCENYKVVATTSQIRQLTIVLS